MEQQAVSHIANDHSEIEKGYESVVKTNDSVNALSVLVKGAHCAACIYKIENALKSDNSVMEARLNFSTGQLNIQWRGDQAFANDYVRTVENLGYEVRPYTASAMKEDNDKQEQFLLLCLGVAGFAAGNIMLVSVGLWATTAETMGMATRDFMHWVSALIAIPTILFSGRPFFRSAFAALKSGNTNMDVPISVGLILTGCMSIFETVHHGEHAYFDSAVMLIFFLLIGRYFDFRARKKAQASASDLLQSFSGFATVLEDGKARHVLIQDIKEGYVIRVSAGEKFPVDGKIIEGMSDADISLVTGETIPVSLKRDELVYAGTVNLSAPVIMVALKAAENSLLSDIAKLMEKAEQGHARYVRMADRAAKLYTPVVHTLALITFIIWWGIIGTAWQDSLMTAITVLIITCPCALGLAVPVVQVLATGKLMRAGILVKSGDALERLADIDKILMDKTGTLTLGKPALLSCGSPENLRIAASLAVHSSHPLSVALTKSYQGGLQPVTDIKEYPGLGLEAVIDHKTVKLGNRKWCGDKNAENTTHMELWLHVEGQPPSYFVFSDALRSDSAETIHKFQKSGLYPILLSGDRKNVVKDIAHGCHIDDYRYEYSPMEKFSYMEALKQKGHKVLMVGDGLNDAPTLAGANVSIAPGTAISLSQNAADIIFMGEKLDPVYEAYKTAQMTQKIVRQNFLLAVIYNVIAIPVAACGLLTPFLAAIAMSGSSLIVILNSFRVRK